MAMARAHSAIIAMIVREFSRVHIPSGRVRNRVLPEPSLADVTHLYWYRVGGARATAFASRSSTFCICVAIRKPDAKALRYLPRAIGHGQAAAMKVDCR
jgi:hypothetical protein